LAKSFGKSCYYFFFRAGISEDETMGLRKALFGLVIATAAVALAAQDAHAFWGHGSWGSWGGSWGGGSCGSSGGSWGSGGSYGSGGSCGGLFHRWGSYGSCGSSGGSWGSSGSCGSCGGYSVSYGSCGSCGGEGGVSYYGGYDGGYAQSTRFVPAGTYASNEPAIKTKLTLRVPAEAKVTLAGVATKQAGEVREFSTDRLAAGQAWQGYTIHVEVVRDGKTVAQDKQITLTGGAAQELSFDFGGEQVAKL
jgi:uncharacterized protein (TIGR03000 family)